MAIDNESWDGAAAMSYCTNADDPAAAYAAVCAGRREGDPALQSTWALPHHRESGMGPNADGVRNSLSRLPQTDGLINHDAAEAHLQAHMDEIHAEEGQAREDGDAEMGVSEFSDANLQVRSDPMKRELFARIVPYNVIGETPIGPEMFLPGSFSKVDPKKVTLSLSHHERFGPPVGRGFSIEEHPDGPIMGFRVSKTQGGDEVLELAKDGVTPHVSVVYHLPTSKGEFQYRDRRRITAWTEADLREVATTWKPVYSQAAVLQVREQEGEAPVADQDKAAVEAAPEKSKDAEPMQARAFEDAVAGFGEKLTSSLDKFTASFGERLEKMEERQRSQFVVPGAEPAKAKAHAGNWMQYALAALSGDRISTNDMQYRDLADLVTSDNLGVVPDAFSTELIGVIDTSRPFMASTRRLNTPSSGMTLHVPKITARPTVGLQSEEKAQISSQATSITTADFSAVTKAGGGDLSLQVLKRSDPSFLDLYLRLLAEAYAMDSESEALESLLGSNVDDGNTIDPATAAFGGAFQTAFSAIRRGPDTIWLSSAAVGAFIDAVSPVTGLPLYSTITADFSVPGGITGSVKGMRPVHVPELGNLGADVIVGPSSGFAWAEDGTYTLQVDVPAKAGRDVAIVGILWFAPWYPEAFTVYTLES